MKYHLKCNRANVEVVNDGFGCYELRALFLRDKIPFTKVILVFDTRNYEHKIKFDNPEENPYYHFEFASAVTDYFYYTLYKYNLIVAKCQNCKNLQVVDNEYRCSVGKTVSLDRVRENCIFFIRNGKRIPKLQKSVLSALELFGEDVVSIKSSAS